MLQPTGTAATRLENNAELELCPNRVTEAQNDPRLDPPPVFCNITLYSHRLTEPMDVAERQFL